MMKRFLNLILIGVLILPLILTACAGAPPATLEGPDQKVAAWRQHTQPVTLTMTSQITMDKSEGYDVPDWGEDAISRQIMDLTGVKLDIKYQGYATDVKIESLVAAGRITDLICTTNADTASFLEDGTICRPLDELAEEYCPEFWGDVDELTRLNNRAADGHIYTLRSGANTQAVYADERIPVAPPWTLNLNKTLLGDRVVPTSVEELEPLLEEVYARTGIAPLVMLGAAESPLPGWMGIRRDLYWDEEARTVRTPLTEDGWLAYAQLMNRWYRHGLLALPGAEDLARDFNGEPDTWLKAVLPETLAFAAPRRYAYQGGIYQGTVRNDDPWPWTVVTEPMTYEGRVQLTAADNKAAWGYDLMGYTAGGGNLTYAPCALFITQACIQPDRALYFMEFLKSEEGAKLTHWGIEGTHYTHDEDGYVTYQAPYQTDASYDWDAGLIYNTWDGNEGLQYWCFVGSDWAGGVLKGSPAGYVANPVVLAMRPQQIAAGLAYKKALYEHRCPALHFAQPAWGSGDYRTLETIVAAWRTGMEEMVTTCLNDGEVEARWRALLDEMATLGLPAVEQGMTVRFAEALKRYQEAGYFTDIQP